ncbi:hypothetical protein FGRMN_4802 [Fusarium graminum]|nr:hypothetical protein FGRMN_4802 [Fusarium graminum]
MASVLAFNPQQQQQSLPIQTLNSGSGGVDDSLITALTAYVTTGANARSTTEQEIHDLASDALSRPGGRAHLEALIACDCPPKKCWKKQSACNGSVKLTKTSMKILLGVPDLDLTFEGFTKAFFTPWEGSINKGTFYYDDFDQLAPGTVIFKVRADGSELSIDVLRHNVTIGHFQFPNLPFTLTAGGADLNGTIA